MNNHYNHYSKNLDKFLFFLDEPNLPLNPTESQTSTSLSKRLISLISTIGCKIITRLARILNYVFGDHYRYDEFAAKHVVQHLISPDRFFSLDQKQIEILGKIQHRLAHISNGLFSSASQAEEVTLPINNKMLFHLNANRFGSGSKLEGISLKQPLEYFYRYLKGQNEKLNHQNPLLKNVLSEIQEQLAEAAHLASCLGEKTPFKNQKPEQKVGEAFIKETQQAIQKAYKHKKNILIPGGWTDSLGGGHAIYYEINPHQGSFRFYNLGAGIKEHNRGDREKQHQPYTEWRGIDPKKFEDPYFLLALYEMLTFTKTPENPQSVDTNYNRFDIYQVLKKFLEPKETDAGEKPPLQMGQQDCGICSVRSLLAFFKTRLVEKLGSEEGTKVYKKLIKCNLRIDALFAKINFCFSPTQVEWRLIDKSFQKTCRSVNKLFVKKLISTTEMKEAEAKLKPVKEWLSTHQSCLEGTLKATSFTYSAPDRNIPLGNPKPALADQILQSTITPQVIPLFTEICKFLIAEATAENMTDTLTRITQQGELSWNNGEDQALYTGLLHCIEKFSKDQSFWVKACETEGKNTPEKAKKLLSLLGELAHLYFKTCFTIPHAKDLQPERLEALHKIQMIQTHLAGAIAPEHWATYHEQENSCFANLFHKNLKTYFTSFDHNRELFTADLKQNEKEQNNSLQFTFDPYQNVGMSSTFIFKQSYSGSFGMLVRQTAPEFMSQLKKNHQTSKDTGEKNFSEMPQWKQDALIYASDDLPSWLKAIRDSNLIMLHLFYEPVAKPLHICRKTYFKHQLALIKNEKSTEIKLSLSGISNMLLAQYPTLQESRCNSKLKFKLVHGQFKSPAIQYFVKHFIENTASKEKTGLTDHHTHQEMGMPEEEFKDLLHLFSNKTTSLVETIEYFTKHPEKLIDRDYQILLRYLFFSNDQLTTQLKNPWMASHFATFFSTYFRKFQEQNENQTCVFLSQMSRLLTPFAPQEPLFKKSLGQLKELLKKNPLDSEEKSIIYSELIAHFAKIDSKDLNDEDLSELLAGIAYIKAVPIPQKWEDLFTKNEAQKAPLLHTQAILKHLCHTAHINAIIRKLKPHFPLQTTWKVHASYFTSGDNQFTYFPFQGTVIDTAKEKQTLPAEIRDHLYFQALFPEISEGVEHPQQIFEFKQGERKTYVRMIDHELILDQLDKEKGWLRFVYPEKFILESKDGLTESSLISRHLVNNFSHWRSLLDPSKLFIRDKEGGPLRYEVHLNRGPSIGPVIASIQKIGTQEVLSKPSSFFTHFESPTFIQEWYTTDTQPGIKSDTPTRVELPRFNLSFIKKGEHFYCEQMPGFYLKPNERLPLLGSYRHYLILENESRIKKILLPQQYFDKPSKKENEEVLQPSFLIDEKLYQKSPQNYLTYHLAKEGDLHANAKEANLYLALVLSLVQEYPSAARYLKKYGEKLKPYNHQEVRILTQLSSLKEISGDKDGNGFALRTYAGYLLLKNHCQSLSKNKLAERIKITEPLRQNYQGYCDRYRNATALRLTEHEEQFIRSIFAQEKKKKDKNPFNFSQLFDSTLTKLKESSHFSRPSFLSTAILPKWPCENLTCKKANVNLEMITRLNINQDNGLQYVALALQGTAEERQWLRSAIKFLKYGVESIDEQFKIDQKKILIALLFEILLDHPEKFKLPIIESLEKDPTREITKKNLIDWITEFGSTLQKLAKNPEYSNQIAAENIPKGYSFDPKDLEFFPFKRKTDAQAQLPKKIGPLTLAVSLPEYHPSFKSIFQTYFEIKPRVLSKGLSKESDAWLKQIEKNHKSDPHQEKAYKALRNDFDTFFKQPQKPTYAISKKQSLEKTLTAMKTALEKEKNSKENQITMLKDQIVALANKLPLEPTEKSQAVLQGWGSILTPITVHEVCVSFGKKEPLFLLNRNPALTTEDVKKLYTWSASYMIKAVHEQRQERLLTSIDKISALEAKKEKDPEMIQDLLQQLGEDLQAERAYDVQKNPGYLTFEYFKEILLREEQPAAVHDLLKKGQNNQVVEKIMGSGKSDVLLPLIAFMLGLNPHQEGLFPLMIVPESLFENISSNTQRILQDAFGLSLSSLHFDRDTAFTVHSLKTILTDLNHVSNRREPMIMTSTSIKCLLLKYIEMVNQLYKASQNNLEAVVEFPEELQLLSDIIQKISADSYAIIDESDTLLNVLFEVCFSIGKPTSINSHEAKTLSEIYILLSEDEQLKAIASLECDPEPNPKAPILTEKLYHKKLKPILAEAFIQKLPKMDFDPELQKEFSLQLKNEDNKNSLLVYLCSNKKEEEEDQQAYNERTNRAQSFFDKLENTQLKDVLVTAKEAISHFLPHTLTQVNREKYGPDSDAPSAIAVPYSSAGNPHHGSIFANPHIGMMYSFQTYLKDGIPSKILVREIERLQNLAMKEMKEKDTLKLNETQAWKSFEKIKGKDLQLPLFKLNKADWVTLERHVNQNATQKINFVENLILPQLTLFEEKLSAHAIHLVSILKKMMGVTGTLWNSMSMHRKIIPCPEIGIMAKTLDLLFSKSRQDVITLKEGSTLAMLKQLKHLNYDMIIDAGGYFKEGDNDQIARQIAKFHQKPVVFFSRDGEKMISDGEKEIPLSQSNTTEENRLTFLDQEHTTGADVKQKRNAVGVMTIKRTMLLRDVAQSAWRLRLLDKEQKVIFAQSTEVESIIQQTLKSKTIRADEICHFAYLNQCRQQGSDNFKSFQQQLWDIPQQLLFSARNHIKPAEFLKLFDILQSLWIKPGSKPARELYGTIKEEKLTTEVVKNEVENCLKLLETAFITVPSLETNKVSLKTCQEEIKQLQEQMKTVLPTKVMDTCQEEEQSVKIETKAELETQAHTLKGKLILGEFNPEGLLSRTLTKNSFPNCSSNIALSNYFSTNETYAPYAKAFKGVHLSFNVLAWSQNSKSLNETEFFGQNRTPLHFLWMEDKITILNQNDAAALWNEKNSALYDLTLGFCHSDKVLTPEQKQTIVKIKFLNGDSYYQQEEIVLLNEWLKTTDVEKMKILFEKHILAGFPQKTLEYKQSSPLLKIFNQSPERINLEEKRKN